MMSQADALRRLEQLEAHQREVTLGAEIDRYLTFVAAVDGLTSSQVQEMRANVMAEMGRDARDPPTDDEIQNVERQMQAMITWEQETVR